MMKRIFCIALSISTHVARKYVVVQLALLAVFLCTAQVARGQGGLNRPKTVIAIQVQKPDFVFWGGKTIFSGEKYVPLPDFDFTVAFADELLAQFSQDQRMQWRLAKPEDQINVSALWQGKQRAPDTLDADRILLGDFYGYGALANLAFGMKDKFYIYGELRLIDRRTGKKLWSANSGEPLKHLSDVHITTKEKLSKLPPVEQQKALKEGTNQIIELFAKKRAEGLRSKQL
jgi:hypothetical protein